MEQFAHDVSRELGRVSAIQAEKIRAKVRKLLSKLSQADGSIDKHMAKMALLAEIPAITIMFVMIRLICQSATGWNWTHHQ